MRWLHGLALVLWISACAFSACAPSDPTTRRLGTLAEVTDPHDLLWAHDELLFVTNADNDLQMRDTILVYALGDLSLQRTVGGPERFKIQSAHSVELVMQPDRFVVNSSGKVSIYDYDFVLLDELEHEGSIYFYEPFGDNFVAREIHYENDVGYYRLNLYDAELGLIRELCRKEFVGRAFSGDFSKKVYGDRLFVAKRTDDFLIEVFDESGNRVAEIGHDYEKVEVTGQHRDEHLNALMSRPGWERYYSSRDEMEADLRGRVVFPERFPAIRRIQVQNDRIYVLTNRQVGDTRELWILDLEGRLLERATIPLRMRSALQWYPFALHNGRVYQLLPEESTGTWSLYQARIE